MRSQLKYRLDLDQGAMRRTNYGASLPGHESKGEATMGLVAQPERQFIFLGEMMERLGIDPGGRVVPRLSLTYLTAFHRCHSCPSKQTCRAWLDNTHAPVTFAPRFCPNADIFFELQLDCPQRHSGSLRTT
jgi:hypothetical protein